LRYHSIPACPACPAESWAFFNAPKKAFLNLKKQRKIFSFFYLIPKREFFYIETFRAFLVLFFKKRFFYAMFSCTGNNWFPIAFRLWQGYT
jgi:hypothetical protein